MFENPAISLYRFWREVVRFHGEDAVRSVRDDSDSRQNKSMNNIDRWSVDFLRYARERGAYPLNYRLALNVTGISARHHDPGLLAPLKDQYEPIITLSLRHWRRWVPLMTLWPNGDFELDSLPYDYYQVFPSWTFFRTGYAAGKRVWSLPTNDSKYGNWLNATDYKEHRMYVPRDSFIPTCSYRLVLNARGQWSFATQGLLDGKEQRATKLLADGHAAVERRYERNRRAAEKTGPAVPPQRLALYVPKHGRMTGQEAVNEMASHMRVYEPAPSPGG